MNGMAKQSYLIQPAAKYPMFQPPCGYIGEQSGHTLSCGHSCLGQIAIGQNATEKQNMPVRQAFFYCTALGVPGHFKPQGRQRCIKENAEICHAGFNIFQHPEKFTAVLEPRLEILEFVVETYLYTELMPDMVSRVNDTKFPYKREYSQPTNLPAQTGRGRGKGKSRRGASKGGDPKGSLAAQNSKEAFKTTGIILTTEKSKRVLPKPMLISCKRCVTNLVLTQMHCSENS